MAERCDVVVLGAGLSGMTAAYRLRDRNVVVLEAEDRVGGRTLSSGEPRSWYNLGAQIISSQRLIDLCHELGLELISIKDADFAFVVNGRFSRGSRPELLLARMNLPLRQRLDFGLTSLRLRRKLHSLPAMDADARAALDQKSLLDVIGRVAPTTLDLLQICCLDGLALRPDEISGMMGLAYALSAYLDLSTRSHISAIRGGSQEVSLAMASRLDGDAVRPGCAVRSVASSDDSVRVTYQTADGSTSEIVADQCICAMPAPVVLETVAGLPSGKRAALRDVTPYVPILNVAWPVADGRPTPWDGVFFVPVAGCERFNLISNYGYLAKRGDPSAGGYLNTVAHGTPAARYLHVDSDLLVEVFYDDLVKIFPEARSLIDPAKAIVKRWPMGLPWLAPGYLGRRPTLREPVGRIVFCGDYTSEPGLAGANNSGHYAAEAVLHGSPATSVAG
jgi:monoamine oxidase